MSPRILIFLAFLTFCQGFLDINNTTDALPANPIARDLMMESISPYKVNNVVLKGNSDPNELSDFAPLRGSLKQSQKQYFQYTVNTSYGIGEVYAFLVLVSGNICSQPPASVLKENNASLTVYISFNESIFTSVENSQMIHFKNGYFDAVTDVPVTSIDGLSTLYIVVQAPENTNSSAIWSYEIGVSQTGLVYQWDNRTWAQLVDTDEKSALIVTGNLSSYSTSMGNVSSLNATQLSHYKLYLYSYEYKDYFALYNRSWCAVRNGPYMYSNENLETSYTYMNGGLQQQFYITGLNASTTYIAYILSDFYGGTNGGILYEPIEFTTMDHDGCELIYGLEFCDGVAYSVPANNASDRNVLKQQYDDQAKKLYQNFSKALQQIACDTVEDAIFSPVGSCEKCAASYKNWLCAVTIPRCSTRNHTGYKFRSTTDNRNEFIDDVVKPSSNYYEVLPCIDVCQAIVRDCPSDFGFLCPTKNATIELSYYWDTGDTEYTPCNYLGNRFVKKSSWANKLKLNWKYLALFTLYLL